MKHTLLPTPEPGRMRAAWSYFVSFQQAAKDFAQLSQTKLKMPVLSVGGEKVVGRRTGPTGEISGDERNGGGD